MYRLQPTLPARGLLAGWALGAAGFWASEAAWLPNFLIATFRAIFQPLWNLSFDHPCLQQTLHWILSFVPHLNPPLYEVPLTSLLLTPSHRASSEGLFTGLCLFSGLCLSPLPISVVSFSMRSHPSWGLTPHAHLLLTPICHHLCPRSPLIYFMSFWFCLLWIFLINGVFQYMVPWSLLLLLSILFLNNRLVPNQERSASRLYIVTLLI